MEMIDELPEEALAPFFKSNEPSEVEKSKSGPSYRQKLMERKLKPQEEGAVISDNEDKAETSGVSTRSGQSPATPAETSDDQVEPVMQPTGIKAPTYPMQQQTPPVPQSGIAHQPSLETARSTISTQPDDARQKIRTLMGLILKHRGGPGFGKGRLKGVEIVRFESLLQEVSALLREEAKSTMPLETHLPRPMPTTTSHDILMPTTTEVQVTSFMDASVTVGEDISPENIDIGSTIACIEGAITMYKNYPPQLQQSVLATLRAALAAAVGTCNTILAAQPPPAMAGDPDGRIDNTIAVIEGAITMYRNSPPALKESVLATFRAALISAVETCSIAIGTEQQSSYPPPPSPPITEYSIKATPPVTDTLSGTEDTAVNPQKYSPATSSSANDTDPNSKSLGKIYEKVKAAAGDGRLGLDNKLQPSEAEELADQLVEMRRILMQELDLGLSQPESVLRATDKEKSPIGSKYQQMLAKARAEKAAG
jgi:hypothetical protein